MAAPEPKLTPTPTPPRPVIDWTPERIGTFRQAATQFFLGTTANTEQDERHFDNLRRFIGDSKVDEIAEASAHVDAAMGNAARFVAETRESNARYIADSQHPGGALAGTEFERQAGSFDSEGYGLAMEGCTESAYEDQLEAEQRAIDAEYEGTLEYAEQSAREQAA